MLLWCHQCVNADIEAGSSAWDFCEQQPILMCYSVLSQQRGWSFGNSGAGELQGGNSISSVHEEQWCIPHWLAANIFLHILHLLFESVVFFNDPWVVQWVDSGIFTYTAAQICVHQGKSPCSVVLSSRGCLSSLQCLWLLLFVLLLMLAVEQHTPNPMDRHPAAVRSLINSGAASKPQFQFCPSIWEWDETAV